MLIPRDMTWCTPTPRPGQQFSAARRMQQWHTYERVHWVHAVEHGAPVLGIALDYIQPEHEMDPIFDAHGSDEVVCNYGPLFDGYQVVVRTAEDIQQVLVTDASKFNVSWPGAPPAYHAIRLTYLFDASQLQHWVPCMYWCA